MKRNLMFLFVGASMVMACQQNQIDVQQGEDDVFYASIENDDRTRTTLDENNNVMWSANDLLTVFKKSSINSKYQVTTSSVGKTTGTFTKVYGGKDDEFTAGGELGHNVAVYPYQDQLAVRRADNSEPASRYEIEGMVLPEEQEYVANSFAEGAFPMAAVSLNNELVFRNVCGGIKLQLKGTQKVTSIKIQGNDKEKLAGNAVLTVYADEDLKPVLTMASDAVKSVTLDCGDGVQLTESSATEFIIALPPVLFSKGFTATVTASDGQTYTVQTDKANTVLRSSLLVMPSVKLGSPIGEDDEDEIAVGQVTLNKSSLVLAGNFEYTLIAKVSPIDATDQSVTWASDNPAVVSVNQNGDIKTISSGTANVTAEAGGVTATCSITVIEQTAYATIDYIDEYGVNHGKGIAIGDVVWAPVNCGYKLPTDDNKGFQYGKLYQWGRKYGQGHNNDELVPVFVEGPISVNNGQNEQYANTFFVLANGHDWAMPKDDSLWNSGTEENPIKTEYDPCPEGWRVPTSTELFELGKKHNPKGLPEYFTGNYTYFDDIPNVMLPNNPFRWDSGEEYNYGRYECYYWSSSVRDEDYVHALNIGVSVYNGVSSRANGCSVRCVQE